MPSIFLFKKQVLRKIFFINFFLLILALIPGVKYLPSTPSISQQTSISDIFNIIEKTPGQVEKAILSHDGKITLYMQQGHTVYSNFYSNFGHINDLPSKLDEASILYEQEKNIKNPDYFISAKHILLSLFFQTVLVGCFYILFPTRENNKVPLDSYNNKIAIHNNNNWVIASPFIALIFPIFPSVAYAVLPLLCYLYFHKKNKIHHASLDYVHGYFTYALLFHYFNIFISLAVLYLNNPIIFFYAAPLHSISGLFLIVMPTLNLFSHAKQKPYLPIKT